MGELSERAGNLDGDSVPVRSDGVEAPALGNWGNEVRAVRRTGGLAVGLVAILTARPSDRLFAQDTTAGKTVYVKWCAGCHGDTGAGDGPAARYMLPRPR